jgi:hypothetical protein
MLRPQEEQHSGCPEDALRAFKSLIDRLTAGDLKGSCALFLHAPASLRHAACSTHIQSSTCLAFTCAILQRDSCRHQCGCIAGTGSTRHIRRHTLIRPIPTRRSHHVAELSCHIRVTRRCQALADAVPSNIQGYNVSGACVAGLGEAGWGVSRHSNGS